MNQRLILASLLTLPAGVRRIDIIATVASALFIACLPLISSCDDGNGRSTKTEQTGENATATPQAAVGPLVVYTTPVHEVESDGRFWPTLAVVTYDLRARREVSRFEVGEVGSFPSQVELVGRAVVVRLDHSLEHSLVAFETDGSGRRTLLSAPAPGGSGIDGFSVSPDESMLAVTVHLSEPGATGDHSIVVLDAANTRVIRTAAVPDALSAVLEWRTDASLVLGPPHGSGHYGLLHPDGTLREVVTGAYSLISPGGRYVAALPGVEGCNMTYVSHEIVVRELDGGEVVASVRDDTANLSLADWSRDGAALYYSTLTYEPDPGVPGCVRTDGASVRWYILRLPGGTVEATDDRFFAERNRYGARLVEYRCINAVVIAAQNCQNERMRAAPVDVYVEGVLVGSGVEARVLGIVE